MAVTELFIENRIASMTKECGKVAIKWSFTSIMGLSMVFMQYYVDFS